jgi:hypothetical protein
VNKEAIAIARWAAEPEKIIDNNWHECLKMVTGVLSSFGYHFPEESCLKFLNIFGDLY